MVQVCGNATLKGDSSKLRSYPGVATQIKPTHV